jgi:hypothetical protein
MGTIDYDRLYLVYKLLIEAGERKTAAGDNPTRDTPAAAGNQPAETGRQKNFNGAAEKAQIKNA